MQKIINFLKEVQAEFKNITWPKKDALIQLTFVVIFISVAISVILGGFDYLFTSTIGYLSSTKNTQTQVVPPATSITPAVTESQLPATTVKPSPKSQK